MKTLKVVCCLLLICAAAMAATHSVTLTWTNPAGTLTGNQVLRGSVSGGPYTVVFTCTTPCTTDTDNSVTSGTTYYYVVTAVNAGGTSGYSNEVTATIPLDAPTGLKVTNVQ